MKFDIGYVFTFLKKNKKMRVDYISDYNEFSEEDRIKAHHLKTKLLIDLKYLCEKGKEAEFNYCCFIMAVKLIRDKTIVPDAKYDSFKKKFPNGFKKEVLDKKNVLKNVYLNDVSEMREQGMSWRQISCALNDKFNFKISHNYLKTLF